MILLQAHTDQQLITLLRKGSDRAYDELFRRYWKKAFLVACNKVKSKVQAEEIVQDIFMDLWNKRATLKITSFEKYLYTSIRYQALNKIRSRIVQQKYWDYYRAFIPGEERTTERTVYYHDLLNSIETCLSQLPGKTKRIFYMNKLEGKSLKEIASHLRLSEKAIEYHLSRSLKELKVYLRNTLLFVVILFLI